MRSPRNDTSGCIEFGLVNGASTWRQLQVEEGPADLFWPKRLGGGPRLLPLGQMAWACMWIHPADPHPRDGLCGHHAATIFSLLGCASAAHASRQRTERL